MMPINMQPPKDMIWSWSVSIPIFNARIEAIKPHLRYCGLFHKPMFMISVRVDKLPVDQEMIAREIWEREE